MSESGGDSYCLRYIRNLYMATTHYSGGQVPILFGTDYYELGPMMENNRSLVTEAINWQEGRLWNMRGYGRDGLWNTSFLLLLKGMNQGVENEDRPM